MRDVSEQKKKSAPEAKGATAVRKFHTHSIPLDMEDIARDWEKPVVDAGIAAKASVIVRVGMLDLGAGTGSFRVREMMHRIAYPLGVHVRADVNLTDIEATCTDGRNRITEVVDLPSTGVNTERIWLLEHFADWFSVNLGKGSMYHVDSQLSDGVVKHLDERDASQYSADLAKRLRERAKVEAEAANGSVDEALDLASKTKVLVTSVAKSLDDDNEEAHRLLADSAEVTPVEDKAAEEKAYDDAEVFTGDSNESVESANAANAEAGAEGAAANGATAESPAASSTKRKNRVPKEYAEHFNERSDEEKAKGGITVRQAHERLDLIERRKPLYKPWFSGLASALACAAFVFLLGGGPYDMIGAFVGAGLGQWDASPAVCIPSEPVLRHLCVRGRGGARLHRHPATHRHFRPSRALARYGLHWRHAVRDPRFPAHHRRTRHGENRLPLGHPARGVRAVHHPDGHAGRLGRGRDGAPAPGRL